MKSFRCIDDIFIIYNLDLRQIFLVYIQQNFSCTKQITWTKKLIGSNIDTSVYDNAMILGFLSLIPPSACLVVIFLDSYSPNM